MKKKILIVDDSITIRQQVTFALAKAGFEVIEAGDGKFGLAALKANEDINLIISDINMPNMNGLDMIEAIQALEKYSNIPVLMLTTEGTFELIHRAKAAGAKGWFVKPFRADQLVLTINKLTA